MPRIKNIWKGALVALGAEALILVITLIALRKGNPSGYYTFFRWGVCPLLCWIGWKSLKREQIALAILAAILAVINNPILRVMMERNKWEVVNIATICVAVWSAIVFLNKDKFPQSRRLLFYDTNFFRALLKGDFHDHIVEPNSDLRVAMKLPFALWRTPFAVMEWLGLNSDKLPKPEPFDPASVEGIDFIVAAFHHYETHYATVLELERQHLEKLAANQRGFVCPRMMDIWDSAMGGVFDKCDVSGWLRFALSFDAVHKLNVPPDYRSDYWSDLIAGAFFKADSRIRNLSKFRLAYRMWNRTTEMLNYPGASPALVKCINETQKLLSLGPWKDYLDGDLIHATAYGVEDSDGTRHRVVCLTCDRPEVVIMRIRLYKGLLSYVHKIYRTQADAEGFSADFESSYNGEVFCFDLKGNLIRRIDVAAETPALSFLGEEPS